MNFVAKYKIAFVAVPKTACSSIKHLFFQLENERSFEIFWANGKAYNVHTIYPSRYFQRGYKPEQFRDHFRFLIVRDPVKRFLSSYSNRVLHYKNLARWNLPREALDAGVAPDPDLSSFIEHLETYRQYSGDIRHHTDPVMDFTGPDLSWFDAVYPIERLGDCQEKLSELVGRPVKIPHEQTGGAKISVKDLASAQLDKIVAFYRQDYDLLSDYYQPPAT